FVGSVNDAEDSIYDIILNGVDSGIQYNFLGDRYPIQLVSKRMLISSDPGNLHTAEVVPVPEPGSTMMLILAAFAVGAWTTAKRYFRQA
ncbi:MAG: PEP-CTERM sorting domain-containing protein, partial [Thermoguttaceae bacterium]